MTVNISRKKQNSLGTYHLCDDEGREVELEQSDDEKDICVLVD